MQSTGMIMLDLQEAFDLVIIAFFVKKNRGYWVTSKDWFKSYLVDRQQVVTINVII